MTAISGTNVASPLAPFTTDDDYATHDAKYGKGGWREVADNTERDAIKSGRLRAGMHVYVRGTGKTWKRNEANNGWDDVTPPTATELAALTTPIQFVTDLPRGIYSIAKDGFVMSVSPFSDQIDPIAFITDLPAGHYVTDANGLIVATTLSADQTIAFLTDMQPGHYVLGRDGKILWSSPDASVAPIDPLIWSNRLWETRRLIAKLRFGFNGQMDIMAVGDSFTYLYWLFYLTYILQKELGDAGPGWMQFRQDRSCANANGPGYAVSVSGTWIDANVGKATADLGSIYANSDDATVTASGPGFVRNLSGVTTRSHSDINEAWLHYIPHSGAVAQYRWNNTGAWTDIDLSVGSNGIEQVNLLATGGPISGDWRLDIRQKTGAAKIELSGVNLKSDAPGVRVHKCGVNGATTANWLAPNQATQARAWDFLAPKLVTILLGSNDQAANLDPDEWVSYSDASAELKVQLVDRVRAARPVADVLFISPYENVIDDNSDTARDLPMTVMNASVRKRMHTKKVPHLLLQPIFGDACDRGDYAYNGKRPLLQTSDPIHPSEANGAPVLASAVAEILLYRGIQ